MEHRVWGHFTKASKRWQIKSAAMVRGARRGSKTHRQGLPSCAYELGWNFRNCPRVGKGAGKRRAPLRVGTRPPVIQLARSCPGPCRPSSARSCPRVFTAAVVVIPTKPEKLHACQQLTRQGDAARRQTSGLRMRAVSWCLSESSSWRTDGQRVPIGFYLHEVWGNTKQCMRDGGNWVPAWGCGSGRLRAGVWEGGQTSTLSGWEFRSLL